MTARTGRPLPASSEGAPADRVARVVARALDRERGARRGVLVACSGGPDSLGLLAATSAWAAGRRVPVTAVVLHHGLRPEAAREVAAVIRAARNLGCAVRAERAAAGRAGAGGEGLQAAGRRLRYDLLARTARASGAGVVLTAHHRGDRAEGFLMGLLRGGSLRALRGPLPRRGLRGTPGCVVLRPLLSVPREDLEGWAARTGVEPARDPTNRSVGPDAGLRALVRMRTIPALVRATGRSRDHVEAHLAAGAAGATLAHGWIARAARRRLAPAPERGAGAVRVDLAGIGSLPAEVVREAVRRAAGPAATPTLDQLDACARLAADLAAGGDPGSLAGIGLRGGAVVRPAGGALTVLRRTTRSGS